MRPDLSQERNGPVFAFSAPFSAALPYRFLPPSRNKGKRKGNEREERADIYTEESREGKESTLLLGGKKWLKAEMNTICWFQRKEEGISRANKRSITGRPASPRYSTMTMLAGAHFLHPPFYTSPWHACFMHTDSLQDLEYWFFKNIANLPFTENTTDSKQNRPCGIPQGCWLLQLTRYNSVRMTQLRGGSRGEKEKRKKNSNINNEVKEMGEENKAVHNKWENRQSVSLRER